ncbi:alpha/beta hydrolase [Pseudoalteromonas haloplanktis]|uniref:Alpha/beta hydrolase n=1 Tax=Pseudoalteromonas haloplanktis TaxID=228 RepID=A0ABU1B9R2_PSEHA|nr:MULTISPECIES: alpha/beta hydrolase [Pseudoalteromonas]MDQ9091091.1 alpha/beta hydrolase [Pseudoalteromonas haloplanktis]
MFVILKKPYTFAHRSWYIEITFRAAKLITTMAEKKPINWLREQELFFSHLFMKKSLEPVIQINVAGHIVKLIKPPNKERPNRMIIYFHGGGFILNGGHFYNRFSNELTQYCSIPTALLDYSLAPEHVYPKAHHDCVAMTKGLFALYPQCQFHFIGDSAGAALLLATYQQLTTPEQQRILSFTLLSPWVDPSNQTPLIQDNEAYDCLTHHNLKAWLDAYYPKPKQIELTKQIQNIIQHPLPPIFIQYAGCEIMAQQIDMFVSFLDDHKVSVTVDKAAHLFHNFQIISMHTYEGKQAIKKIVRFLTDLQ